MKYKRIRLTITIVFAAPVVLSYAGFLAGLYSPSWYNSPWTFLLIFFLVRWFVTIAQNYAAVKKGERPPYLRIKDDF